MKQASFIPNRERWLHPCKINGTWHLIHHPELEVSHPLYFARVIDFAQRCGYTLLADRRNDQNPSRFSGRRRQWFPMIVLGLGLKVAAADHTDPNHVHLHAINPGNTVIEKTVEPETSLLREAEFDALAPQPHPAKEAFIKDVLLDHWHQTSADPRSLLEDLSNMARYFSQFPQVFELFKTLENKEWSLRYGSETFETKIEGKNMAIERVEVVFDPRSAAQFRFHKACDVKRPHCVASPADVFLHELLHVSSVLNNPEEFIASGGLGNMLYPYQHERDTIDAERRLYRAMSASDEQARPLRNEHSGRHVLVACVTCIN